MAERVLQKCPGCSASYWRPDHEAELARLRSENTWMRECLADAFAAYCRENPDPDHVPEPWAEAAQDLLGSERAAAIYNAAREREAAR